MILKKNSLVDIGLFGRIRHYYSLISMFRLEIHMIFAGNGATKIKGKSSKFAIISLTLVVMTISSDPILLITHS